MDVGFVNPFVSSTINTFRTMAGTELTPGKPAVKTEPFPAYDISGVIGLTGDATGCITLSFPKTVALKIVSRFMGEELKIVGEVVTDAIGELTNIVAGSAKKDLVDKNVSISLPNVIVGKDHHLNSPKDVPCFLVPFTTAIGNVALEVSLKTA